MQCAPIAIFCFNRPDHLKRTLEALTRCNETEQSQIYIFQDWKDEPCDEVIKVNELIKSTSIGRSKELIVSSKNKGLADSIIEGISYVLERHDSVIVLEDDILVSKGFLRYMNEGLNLYRSESSVMHISAYMFPLKGQLPETFFYSTASCWGWGTWRDSWSHYKSDCKELYDELKVNESMKFRFNINGAADFYRQLEANVQGEMNTWAVKWYGAIFRNNGLALHPRQSLTTNIGMDGSGVHCEETQIFDAIIADNISVLEIPLEENEIIRNSMAYFYRTQKSQASSEHRFLRRLGRKFSRIITGS